MLITEDEKLAKCEYNRDRRLKRKENGICQQCDREVVSGRTRCEKHLKEQNIDTKERRKKK